MPYLTYEGGYLLVASNGSLEVNPGWYFNLQQNNHAAVQLRAEVFEVEASNIVADQRRSAWEYVICEQPRYEQYQLNIKRMIPLVLLHK